MFPKIIKKLPNCFVRLVSWEIPGHNTIWPSCISMAAAYRGTRLKP